MHADLAILDAHLVLPDGIVKGGLTIKNGKITKITKGNNLPSANRTINGKGLFLLPGIIDIHVHTREPGYEYKEDFSTASAAAAGSYYHLRLAEPYSVHR